MKCTYECSIHGAKCPLENVHHYHICQRKKSVHTYEAVSAQ